MEDTSVRKAVLQMELVKESFKLFSPMVIDIVKESKPVVDAVTDVWVESLGRAYKRLIDEYGCSDETARALLTLSYAEFSKSIASAMKK